MGSIGGGARYNNLTEVFGVKEYSRNWNFFWIRQNLSGNGGIRFVPENATVKVEYLLPIMEKKRQ